MDGKANENGPIKIALINNANFVMRHQLQTINFNVIHTDFTLLAKSLWARIILTSQWKTKFHVWSKCVEDMEITCTSLFFFIMLIVLLGWCKNAGIDCHVSKNLVDSEKKKNHMCDRFRSRTSVINIVQIYEFHKLISPILIQLKSFLWILKLIHIYFQSSENSL